MGAWIWGSAGFAIALAVAGGLAWWLARGCVVTRIGAVGAVVGGVLSLGGLILLIDPDAAFRLSASVTIVSGAWLFAWALAGGIRGQLIDRRARLVRLEAADPAASAKRDAAAARSRDREATRV